MKQEKVDKGFELLYKNLSYRRKFIRTLWMIPIGIGVGMLITYIFENSIFPIIYWMAFIPIGLIQLIDNYTKLQKEKKK